MTKSATLNATIIGMTNEEMNDIKVWLTETRVSQCADSLRKWLIIGGICSKIKAANLEGKFSDNVNTIIGAILTNDERQYSMKLYDAEKSIVKWYKEVGCLKYNPRTIYTAYQNFLKPPKKVLTADEKKAEKAEKAEKELRKERKGIDALSAFAAYRLIRDKAGKDGNLVLGDLETLKAELEGELKAICEAIELEAPVVEAKPAPIKRVKKADKKAA